MKVNWLVVVIKHLTYNVVALLTNDRETEVSGWSLLNTTPLQKFANTKLFERFLSLYIFIILFDSLFADLFRYKTQSIEII